MASITVQRVQVLDNPSTFLSDFRFEITFECIAPINDGKLMGRPSFNASIDLTTGAPYDGDNNRRL